MKKFNILATFFVLFAICMTGCGANEKETVSVLPTYEELVAINKEAEILKEHKNIYVTAVSESDVIADYNYTEAVLFVPGEDKVDYHKKLNYAADDFYSYTSSTANGYYYVAPEYVVTMLEAGEAFWDDYTLDLDFTPVGKAYLEDNQIVHHAYYIYEAIDGFTASRADYTLYFNKDTKLIEKIFYVEFDNNHEICATYTANVSYDVDLAKTAFDTTAYELVCNGEDNVSVEVIVNANTPEEKAYQFLSTLNAELYAIIDCEVYDLYVDAEYSQPITVLSGFEGQDTVTLYAMLNEYYQQKNA